MLLTHDIDSNAKIIWDYMLLHQPLKACDVMLVLGSIDDRVAEYASDLFQKNFAPLVIISGGSAHPNDLLATNWQEPTEADHFAAIMITRGVPSEKILLETKATNTGENILFVQELIRKKNVPVNSLLLVQKPYMERRVYATFKKQWHGNLEIVVTSPPIEYENYFDNANSKEKVINLLVGDLQRILEYPKLGYQIEQSVPEDVRTAYQALIQLGFTQHLMKE